MVVTDAALRAHQTVLDVELLLSDVRLKWAQIVLKDNVALVFRAGNNIEWEAPRRMRNTLTRIADSKLRWQLNHVIKTGGHALGQFWRSQGPGAKSSYSLSELAEVVNLQYLDAVVDNILNRRYRDMVGDEHLAFLDVLSEL